MLNFVHPIAAAFQRSLDETNAIVPNQDALFALGLGRASGRGQPHTDAVDGDGQVRFGRSPT